MSHTVHEALFYGIFGVVNVAIGVTFYVLYMFHIDLPIVVMEIPPVTHYTARQASVMATSGIPVRVVVPSIAVDVNVGIGQYDVANATWTLDNERAFYADTSVPANNNNGVTLLYGHARRSVFGRLDQVSSGAKATVYTDSGYAFNYVYQSKQDVSPTDTSFLHVDGSPTLVLQTCSGPWDAYRTLVSFRLTGQQRT